MGGEKLHKQAHLPHKRGSPPHGRGKGRPRRLERGSVGITPAWAGKRQRSADPACRKGDHPRMGGEKNTDFVSLFVSLGSPPHGRGKGQVSVHQLAHEGITPAWAGKSKNIINTKNIIEDHPRMGGEKLAVEDTNHSYQGSPPHGRGKGSLTFHVLCIMGITPAWAGKRPEAEEAPARNRDHPRMGGEKRKPLAVGRCR